MSKKFTLILLATFIATNSFGIFDETRSKLRRAGISGDVTIRDIEILEVQAGKRRSSIQSELNKIVSTKIPDGTVKDSLEKSSKAINDQMETLKKRIVESKMASIIKEFNIKEDDIDTIKLNLKFLSTHYEIENKIIKAEIDAIKAYKKILSLMDWPNYNRAIAKELEDFEKDQRKMIESVEKEASKHTEGPKGAATHQPIKSISEYRGPKASDEYFSDRKRVYESMQKGEADKFEMVWKEISGLSARDKGNLSKQYEKDVASVGTRGTKSGVLKKATLFERWKLENSSNIRQGLFDKPEENFISMMNQASRICFEARKKIIEDAARINSVNQNIQNPSEKTYVAPSTQQATTPAPTHLGGRTRFGESETGEEMKTITPQDLGKRD